VTDRRADRAPGDAVFSAEPGASGVLVYTTGLVLAALLTATSFWVANTSSLWAPGVPLGLAVLAIAQMGVHLVFFLHIGSGREQTNNILALAFGLLIVFLVVAGSVWIMTDLDANMMRPESAGHSEHRAQNVRMPVAPATITTSAARCAKIPLQTTPTMSLMRDSIAAGSLRSSPCTSRITLPLSVTKRSR